MVFLSTALVLFSAAAAPQESAPRVSPNLTRPAERAGALRLKLPFAEGAKFLCCQGIGGIISHQRGSLNEFAWDFEMPVGTPVHASAHGRVVLVVDEHSKGGYDESMRSKANAVWIDHGGGALSSYVHLAQDSSLVQVGQLVRAGQPIALSGNTGYSVGPHLHFAVINSLGKSLKASFIDAGVPVEGKAYVSQNDGNGCTWWTGDSKIPEDLFADAGIHLSVAPSAHIWDPKATQTFAGHCPWKDKVVFFASTWTGGRTLIHKQVPVRDDGSFEVNLEPPALRYLLSHSRFRVSMAPRDADGKFGSSDMLGIHWIESAPNEARRVHLPFFGDAVHCARKGEVISVGHGKAKRELHCVTTQLDSGQGARACAGGRVIQVSMASKAGIRSIVSSRSACVHVDHGGGLEVLYAGLDPGSVMWAPGDVVSGGSVLGTVGVKAVTASRKLLLVSVGAQDGPLHFIEGPSRAKRSSRVVGRDGPVKAVVFGRDSTLPLDAFVSSGITLAPDRPIPASTYHVGTRYVIQGTTEEPSGTVEFLIRRASSRAAKVVAMATSTETGAFKLVVVLPESLKDEPYRFALTTTAGKSKRRKAPVAWRPLLAIR